WMVFYRVSGFGTLHNPDPMATWRDHAAILDAVRARDVAAVRDRLDRHYAGISQVIEQWRRERAAP
ncbi:MAG: FCD domain-containing protein, partial [Alphaproteobacteria bacterium]|nr:FCD domain-containing protein [Alphaproteobacteria bacterium]